MDRARLRRVLLILLALAFLTIGIVVLFALAAHASCSAKICGLCVSLANLRETLRVFEVPVGFLALLVLLQLALRKLLDTQTAASLVGFKARLNN